MIVSVGVSRSFIWRRRGIHNSETLITAISLRMRTNEYMHVKNFGLKESFVLYIVIVI